VTPEECVGEPIWLDLDEPRGLSDPERWLLTTLTAAVDEPLLQEQVSTVVVVGVCRCGCSSVRLRSEQQPIPADRVAQLSDIGRSDYFAVEAVGAGSTPESVNVVLHVMRGLVVELEVFDVERGESF
jgi:hypothetical protein